MNEPVVTIVGNAASDPELKFLPSGQAVTNLTIASTPRVKNRQTDQWEDGETLWVRGAVFGQAAEHVAESISKGTRVIATGRLKVRSYETRNGDKRTDIELAIDEIGPSLKYATARVTRAQRGGGRSDDWGTSASGGWDQTSNDAPF